MGKGAQKRRTAVFRVKLHFTWTKSATKFLCVNTVSDKVIRHHWPIFPRKNTVAEDVSYCVKIWPKLTNPLQNGVFQSIFDVCMYLCMYIYVHVCTCMYTFGVHSENDSRMYFLIVLTTDCCCCSWTSRIAAPYKSRVDWWIDCVYMYVCVRACVRERMYVQNVYFARCNSLNSHIALP